MLDLPKHLILQDIWSLTFAFLSAKGGWTWTLINLPTSSAPKPAGDDGEKGGVKRWKRREIPPTQEHLNQRLRGKPGHLRVFGGWGSNWGDIPRENWRFHRYLWEFEVWRVRSSIRCRWRCLTFKDQLVGSMMRRNHGHRWKRCSTGCIKESRSWAFSFPPSTHVSGYGSLVPWCRYESREWESSMVLGVLPKVQKTKTWLLWHFPLHKLISEVFCWRVPGFVF